MRPSDIAFEIREAPDLYGLRVYCRINAVVKRSRSKQKVRKKVRDLLRVVALRFADDFGKSESLGCRFDVEKPVLLETLKLQVSTFKEKLR